MLFITPNEAALIGAFGGAALGGALGVIGSIFVARYTVKHSANYSGQIADINKALGALADTQEEMRCQHASAVEAEQQHRVTQEQKAEAARWKPNAHLESRVEGNAQVNELILKSSQGFSLVSASLVAPNGAKLADYPVTPGLRVPASVSRLDKPR